MNGSRFAVRFRSKSTSSLPFFGRAEYSVLTTASVLTVASTSDWNVRMGARRESRPSACWRSIWAAT